MTWYNHKWDCAAKGSSNTSRDRRCTSALMNGRWGQLWGWNIWLYAHIYGFGWNMWAAASEIIHTDLIALPRTVLQSDLGRLVNFWKIRPPHGLTDVDVDISSQTQVCQRFTWRDITSTDDPSIKILSGQRCNKLVLCEIITRLKQKGKKIEV